MMISDPQDMPNPSTMLDDNDPTAGGPDSPLGGTEPATTDSAGADSEASSSAPATGGEDEEFDYEKYMASEADDDDDDGGPDGFSMGASSGSVAEVEEEPEEDVTLSFDLREDEIESFSALQTVRGEIFTKRGKARRFRDVVHSLGTEGEEGRRRGLGLWMIGEHDEAVEILSRHESDDVASFTLATCLMSMGRYADAEPIFARLSNAYPEVPRPRAGMLEARLEVTLASGDEEKALADLEAALAAAPESFREDAEGHYVSGRIAELKRDWETALDEYEQVRLKDPTHRAGLFRGGYRAERCGLDDEALVFYRALARNLPMDRNAMMNFGVLLEDLGHDQEAAACYDTIIKDRGEDDRARLYLQDARSAMDMYYDEDLERKEDRLNQILRTPITDFELSVRARNCLNKMNIVTLGDLVRKTEQELLAYKNFGETSLNEIKEILGSKNLRLGMAHEEAVASIEAATRPRATGENAEQLNRPIAELDLSIRARRTVEALGCLTISDVVQHTEDELLGMPNFGVTSLQELKRKLTERGFALREKDKKRKKK